MTAKKEEVTGLFAKIFEERSKKDKPSAPQTSEEIEHLDIQASEATEHLTKKVKPSAPQTSEEIEHSDIQTSEATEHLDIQTSKGKDSKSKGKDPKYQRTTVYLEKDLHQRLKLAAIKDGREMSGIISDLLKEWLDSKDKHPSI